MRRLLFMPSFDFSFREWPNANEDLHGFVCSFTGSAYSGGGSTNAAAASVPISAAAAAVAAIVAGLLGHMI